MTKVAVVILNYNGADFLKQFLPGVIQNTRDAEIIVADNCSTDNSLEVLSHDFPEVKTIILSENFGYAGGYNAALKQIEAEYYLLLNSDVEVTPSWLNPLVQFLDTNPNYAAVQPKILDYHRRSYFEYAGAAGGFVDKLGYPYCRGRIFEEIEQDHGQYDSEIDVDWCTGACFLVRSEVFHQLHGFDADFFAHMEEIDLCWRIRNHGQNLRYLPSSTVFHVGGGTLNKTSPNKTYLNFRNNMAMLLKNLPASTLLWMYPLRSGLDLLAAMKMWKDQGFPHFKAVVRAFFHNLKNLRSICRKRTIAGKLKSTPVLLIFFYLKKRKTYSSLNNTK